MSLNHHIDLVKLVVALQVQVLQVRSGDCEKKSPRHTTRATRALLVSVDANVQDFICIWTPKLCSRNVELIHVRRSCHIQQGERVVYKGLQDCTGT